MRAAANFAWCNRQLLMWQTREVFAEFFGRTWESLRHEPGLRRGPQHRQDRGARGRRPAAKTVCVHRKGATRAFPAGHPEVPRRYRAIGQPVIIPGDMGRASWVLVGQPGSMEQTFGTTCHGAGRAMSRTAAVKHAQGRRIDQRAGRARRRSPGAAAGRGSPRSSRPPTRTSTWSSTSCTAPGCRRKVARLRPIGVIKG